MAFADLFLHGQALELEIFGLVGWCRTAIAVLHSAHEWQLEAHDLPREDAVLRLLELPSLDIGATYVLEGSTRSTRSMYLICVACMCYNWGVVSDPNRLSLIGLSN